MSTVEIRVNPTPFEPGDSAVVNRAGNPAAVTLGSASASDVGDFATAAQGSTADSAVQPGDLSAVATTGDYGDLNNLPTLFDGDYNSLSNIPTEFTPEAHTHIIADVVGLQSALDEKVEGDGITKIEAVTQAEYDALTPDAETLYVITDAT